MEGILQKEIITNRTACRALGVFIFLILTIVSGFLRVPLPFSPVPITLQTFFVLLSGAFLGSNLGITVQLSYILLGIFGLPIFTGAGSGILYLCGPTAGYLFGFLLAAFFLGRWIKYAGNNFYLIFGMFCLADLLLLAAGVFWLKALLGYPLKKVLLIGFFPFIPGDLLKACLAAGLYLRLKSRLKEIF